MMTQPVFVWTALILLVGAAFLFRGFEKFRVSRSVSKRKHHFVEMAKEKDLFYCPGDEVTDER